MKKRKTSKSYDSESKIPRREVQYHQRYGRQYIKSCYCGCMYIYIYIAVLERVEECNLPLFDVIPKFGWELSQECSSIEKLAAFWVPNAAMRCEGLICVRVTKSPHAVFIACSPKRVSLARSRTWLSLKIGHPKIQ